MISPRALVIFKLLEEFASVQVLAGQAPFWPVAQTDNLESADWIVTKRQSPFSLGDFKQVLNRR